MCSSDLENIDEAKQRAAQFIKKVRIKGKDSQGNKIITNLEYLKDNLDRLLTF